MSHINHMTTDSMTPWTPILNYKILITNMYPILYIRYYFSLLFESITSKIKAILIINSMEIKYV